MKQMFLEADSILYLLYSHYCVLKNLSVGPIKRGGGEPEDKKIKETIILWCGATTSIATQHLK